MEQINANLWHIVMWERAIHLKTGLHTQVLRECFGQYPYQDGLSVSLDVWIVERF